MLPINDASTATNKITHQRLELIALVGFMIPFAVYLWVAMHARYAADDYCEFVNTHLSSIPQTIVKQYHEWSGRFAYHFIAGLARHVHPVNVGVVILFMLLLWLVFLVMVAVTLTSKIKVNTGFAVALSLLLIAVTLGTSPALFQSAYWIPGALNYSLPLALICLILWLLLSHYDGALAYSGCTIVGFVIGGLSEIGSIALLIALIFVFLAIPSARRKAAAAFIGTTIGLVIVITAPGSMIRRSHFPSIDTLDAAIQGLRYAAYPLSRAIRESPITIAGLVLLPGWIAMTSTISLSSHDKQRYKVLLLWLILGVTCINAVCMFAAYYSTAKLMVERARIIPNFLTFAAIMVGAWIVGTLLRRQNTNQPSLALFLAALVVCAALTVQAVIVSVPINAYANAWDERSKLYISGQSELYSIAAFDLVDTEAEALRSCAEQMYSIVSEAQ